MPNYNSAREKLSQRPRLAAQQIRDIAKPVADAFNKAGYGGYYERYKLDRLWYELRSVAEAPAVANKLHQLLTALVACNYPRHLHYLSPVEMGGLTREQYAGLAMTRKQKGV